MHPLFTCFVRMTVDPLGCNPCVYAKHFGPVAVCTQAVFWIRTSLGTVPNGSTLVCTGSKIFITVHKNTKKRMEEGDAFAMSRTVIY